MEYKNENNGFTSMITSLNKHFEQFLVLNSSLFGSTHSRIGKVSFRDRSKMLVSLSRREVPSVLIVECSIDAGISDLRIAHNLAAGQRLWRVVFGRSESKVLNQKFSIRTLHSALQSACIAIAVFTDR